MVNRILAVLLVAASTGFAACSDVTEPPSAPSRQSLDGEAIFRGVIFGEQAVADVLPEVWNHVAAEQPEWTAEQRQAAAEARSQMIADIRAADASFFERFRAAMTSGQHLRVERALEEARTLLIKVVESRYGTARYQAVSGVTGTCIVLNFNLYVNVNINFNVNVNVNLAVNVNVAVNFNLWLPETAPSTGEIGSALYQEQLVHVLAERLHNQ